jgi:hypothetical protein
VDWARSRSVKLEFLTKACVGESCDDNSERVVRPCQRRLNVDPLCREGGRSKTDPCTVSLNKGSARGIIPVATAWPSHLVGVDRKKPVESQLLRRGSQGAPNTIVFVTEGFCCRQQNSIGRERWISQA